MQKFLNMSDKERNKITELWIKGLELAEYRTLRRKAMLNENVVHSDEAGNPIFVPAREVYTKPLLMLLFVKNG